VVRKHPKTLGFAPATDSVSFYQVLFSRTEGNRGDKGLGRLFFAFPRGWPGVALLLLRAVFGLAVLAEGGYYLSGSDSTPSTWVIGLSAFAAGALLLVGFLTPIAALLVAAGVAGVGFSLLPACSPSLFDARISLIFGLTMLATIVGLGPGAFSVDARVFGRREIIIPPPVDNTIEVP